MKSKNNELAQRILTLLKFDANDVFSRIKTRKSEYLEIFALRRTREHFDKIFYNRYQSTPLHDLSHCSVDLIIALNQFYQIVDELSWYLYQTEDMPNTLEDFLNRKISKMEKYLATLNLFIDAELGVQSTSEDEVHEKFLEDEKDSSL